MKNTRLLTMEMAWRLWTDSFTTPQQVWKGVLLGGKMSNSQEVPPDAKVAPIADFLSPVANDWPMFWTNTTVLNVGTTSSTFVRLLQ